jgi:hypothetical protein
MALWSRCLLGMWAAFCCVSYCPEAGMAATYYVSPDGSDSQEGSIDAPWRTIQMAAQTVAAGDTVYVRAGTYHEQVAVAVSGSAEAGLITFRNYPGEDPVIDGTGLTVPATPNGLFLIRDQGYIAIEGFTLQNYQTSTRNVVPVAIHVRGIAHHIAIRNNRIHDIATKAKVDAHRLGADAHAIAVYGTSGTQSINNITIDANVLYNLTLGSSEAIVINGNVETFAVTDNIVYYADNIAIDCIGFEGTSPDTVYDQARNSLIAGNIVYGITSYNNPAYGKVYSAGGIYIDGGTDIIVEKNVVIAADIGIEIASEHKGKATSNIVVRNNVLGYNRIAGISMGGYDTDRGSTENCTVVNNTLYLNDTRRDGNGELLLQYDTRNNTIVNNIFYANRQGLLIGNAYSENSGNFLDYNIYYAATGSKESEWQWKGTTFQGFSTYRNKTGNDVHSSFVNPRFVNRAAFDLHLQASSAAIDMGTGDAAPADDFDGDPRPQGQGYDVGADEYMQP